MKLTIDSQTQVLTRDEDGCAHAMPLYSREAFEALSREWVRIGWALGYYGTFTWCGQPVLQLPEDLVRMQEVIADLRPDIIIETGIYLGGSLLFYASLCEALGTGRVIGVDRAVGAGVRAALTGHRLSHRMTIVEGDSTSPATVAVVQNLVGPRESVLVILDSDHSCRHVARELEAYAPLVTPGSWIVVADGIMRDLTDVPGGETSWTEDSPATAALRFLEEHPEFVERQPQWRINRSQLCNNITYWPQGWLWKSV